MVIRATIVVHGAHPTPMMFRSDAVEGVVVRDEEQRGTLVMKDGTRLPIDDADFVLAQMTLGIPVGVES